MNTAVGTAPVIFELRGKRVFVAGHAGMAGSAIVRRLEREGCDIVSAPRQELDLRNSEQIDRFMAQVKPDADRMGLTARLEAAGALVLSGMCFYNSYAREMAQANQWRTLATNSAKLTNILGGYGYQPMLASMEACVDAAVTGKLS